MKNSRDNKTRLQEYLDKWEMDYVVDKRIKLCGFAYWGILYNTSFSELVNKLGEGLDYVGVEFNYVLIKESNLIEKYGDPFNFSDDFSVKGKSAFEIKERLRAFDFDFEGAFVDCMIGSKLCFIRVNSINQNNTDKLSNILKLSGSKIGRLEDKNKHYPLFSGKGWFYFKV